MSKRGASPSREHLEACVSWLHECGFAIVPIEPTEEMLNAKDEDGDLIWAGGVEHYFRNDEEADWYARQVWKSMVSNAPGLPDAET